MSRQLCGKMALQCPEYFKMRMTVRSPDNKRTSFLFGGPYLDPLTSCHHFQLGNTSRQRADVTVKSSELLQLEASLYKKKLLQTDAADLKRKAAGFLNSVNEL